MVIFIVHLPYKLRNKNKYRKKATTKSSSIGIEHEFCMIHRMKLEGLFIGRLGHKNAASGQTDVPWLRNHRAIGNLNSVCCDVISWDVWKHMGLLTLIFSSEFVSESDRTKNCST